MKLVLIWVATFVFYQPIISELMASAVSPILQYLVLLVRIWSSHYSQSCLL